MFSYSQLQGFLLLPDEAKQLHNVSTQFVIVSRHDMKVSERAWKSFLHEQLCLLEFPCSITQFF